MKRQTALAIVALATAAAIGCGGSGRNGGASAPSQPRSATENQMNPLSRDKIQDGGRMIWTMDEMPPNFNYNQIDGTEGDNFNVIGALMPGVFRADAEANLHWDHDYLASEPVLTSTPKETVTYEINPKAAWDDGTPLTWEDFYWQWKATNGTDKAYRISSSNGYENVDSVRRGKDDREVVVTFAHPYADWQALFNPIYPASTDKDPKVFNEGWAGKFLVTGGPFKFGSLDSTAKTITLVRNPKWWGAPAKLDSIVFRALDINAHIDALANGEVDEVDIGPDVNQYQRARQIEGVEIRTAGGPNFRHITINGSGPILSDVRVRRAFAMAINRDAIARAMLGPLNIPAVPLNNHVFMANQAGYQDNSDEIGKYNPAKAKQLLDEAGWKLVGDVRQKDGKPLQLSCIIPTAIATSQQESELIQNMVGQVGIRLNITAVPSNDFFDKYIIPGQYDVTVFSWFGTAFPISSIKSIYATPARDANGQMHVQQNFARVGSPEIDQLLAAASAELDHKKAIAIANHIDALIWQEVHSLPLYQRPELIATKKGLANFGAKGFADYVYQDIGWAKGSNN